MSLISIFNYLRKWAKQKKGNVMESWELGKWEMDETSRIQNLPFCLRTQLNAMKKHFFCCYFQQI